MLDRILAAATRIQGNAQKTPVMTSRQLDEVVGGSVYVKCENLQKAGAFKFRGAFNTISQLSEKQIEKGVITHSSGNHAQAVAITGMMLGIKTVIVMPDNSPQVKVNATKGYGAEVVRCEATQKAREETVDELIAEHGYTLVHPYDNDNIIAGAATASKELLDEVKNLDFIVAPIGGGGIMSGTALYSKLSGADCTVIAAEPYGADDAYRSYTTGNHVTEQQPTTIADGLRTTLSKRTLRYVREYVDDIIRVNDTQILESLRFLMERMKIIVEPSGAVPVSAVMNDDRFYDAKTGVIITGGNLDLDGLFKRLTPLDI